MKVQAKHGKLTQNMHGASRNYRYVWDVSGPPGVTPDTRYCSRSRRFHLDPGTKHISVPPRHMTKPYAPDFQHDITTLQIQGYNISYNRHTTASNTIQQRNIHVWVQTTIKCLVEKRTTSIP